MMMLEGGNGCIKRQSVKNTNDSFTNTSDTNISTNTNINSNDDVRGRQRVHQKAKSFKYK